MELKQRLIHRKYKKAEAKSQITVGDDVSIPEGKPDAAQILQRKAELLVEEVHTEKGKIRVKGKLSLRVLYLAERAAPPVAELSAEFPFDEILYMEGASTGDNLTLDWKIEELRVTIIHPGKFSVRAVVTLIGSIAAAPGTMITENVEESAAIYTRGENFSYAEPVLERKDSFRMRDEVLLPVNKPNVRNILWKDIQLRGIDLRLQEGRIAVKGEALLFLLYEGEEEQGAVQWLEQSVPFHGILEADGVSPEMFGTLKAETAHRDIELKPDYDGEMRMLQLELLLDIHMHIYEERKCTFLSDAYSTTEQLTFQRQEAACERLRICNQMKCRVSAREKTDGDSAVLQILGHHAELQSAGQKRTDEGILCEGVIEVQVLYITADDSHPFGSATVSVPYSQLMESTELAPDDTWNVNETVEQIFITMPESGMIEVRAAIVMDVCVMEQCLVSNITEVTSEPYDPAEYKKRPGMCIHFVQPGENLWEIAKKNRITVENIKKLNDLPADEIMPGQKLILVKQAAG